MKPKGFVKPGNENLVYLLKKSLYQQQSPGQYYMKFDNFIIKIGFVKCNYDNCVFFQIE